MHRRKMMALAQWICAAVWEIHATHAQTPADVSHGAAGSGVCDSGWVALANGSCEQCSPGRGATNAIHTTTAEVNPDRSSGAEEEVLTSLVYLGSSDLELMHDGSEQLVGVLFTDLGVPPDTYIVHADILFDIDEVKPASVEQVMIAITAEANVAARLPRAVRGDISSRPRVNVSVQWSPEPSVAVHDDLVSPDIGPVVQAVVDMPGWSLNGSLFLIFSHVASEGHHGVRWVEQARINNGVQTPQLRIVWHLLDSSACPLCAPGRIDADSDASTPCEKCPAGKIEPGEGRTTTCSGTCGPGTSAPPGSTACLTCIAGTYDDDSDSTTECTLCDRGRFGSTAGATSRDDGCSGQCGSGTSSEQGSTTISSCVPCPAGKVDHDNTSTTACQDCPAGRYESAIAALSCTGACTPGSFGLAGSDSESNCVSCPAGKTDSDIDPSTPCELCPTGKFHGTTGRVLPCYDCPTGHSIVGATRLQGCNAMMESHWVPCTGHCDVPTHGENSSTIWTYGWVDITQLGWNIPSDAWQHRRDDGYIAWQLPFTFIYFGTGYNAIQIGTNGYIAFKASTPLFISSAFNFPTPTDHAGCQDALLGVFWSDFDTGGEVFVQGDSTAVVVSWVNVQYLGGSAGSTFQVLLFPNGDIVYQYKTMNDCRVMDKFFSVGFQQPRANGTAGRADEMASGSTACPKDESAFVLYSTGGVVGVPEFHWTHHCRMCPQGYELSEDGSQIYTDVDECSRNNGGCDLLAVPVSCTNLVGSYQCGDCPEGLVGHPNIEKGGCHLPDEASLHDGEALVIPTVAVAIDAAPIVYTNALGKADVAASLMAAVTSTMGIGVGQVVVENIKPSVDAGRRRLQAGATGTADVSFPGQNGTIRVVTFTELLLNASSRLYQSTELLASTQSLEIEYLCPVGTVRPEGGTLCQTCPWPQYTGDRLSCSRCPPFQTPTARGDGCSCMPGYYNASATQPSCHKVGFARRAMDDNAPNAVECLRCDHLECIDTCQGDNLVISPGWAPIVREDKNTLPIFACRYEGSCPGGVVANNLTRCTTGYTGVLCGICEDDFSLNRDGSCSSCGARSASVPMMIALAMLLSVVVCKNVQFIESHAQQLGKLWKLSRELNIKAIGKVLLASMQIVGNIGIVLALSLPDIFSDLLKTVASWINFNLAALFRLGCIFTGSYWSGLASSTLAVVCMTLMIYFMYALSTRRAEAEVYDGNDERAEEHLRDLFEQFDPDFDGIDRDELAVVLKKVHPDATDNDVDTIFDKADLDSDGIVSFDEFHATCTGRNALKDHHSHSLMDTSLHSITSLPLRSMTRLPGSSTDGMWRTDGSVNLGSLIKRKQLNNIREDASSRLFIVVFLMYPGLTNTIFNSFQCRDLGDGALVLEVDYTMDCTSVYYYELIAVTFVLLLLWSFGLPGTLLWTLCKFKESIREKDQDVLDKFDFVIGDYKLSHYYWEVVEMVRKLLLSGIVGLFRRGTIAQTLIATVISFVFFAISFREQPFKAKVLNLVKVAAEAQVFGVLLVCVVLQTHKSGFATEGLSEHTLGMVQVALTLTIIPITAIAIRVGVRDFRAELSEENAIKERKEAARAGSKAATPRTEPKENPSGEEVGNPLATE